MSYKKEFKSYLQNNKTSQAYTVINITPSELYTNSKKITWEDNNKEVFYEDNLYDVISYKTKGLLVELILISDKQEMYLKKQFSQLFDLSSQSKTKEPFSLLKNFLALKYLVNSSFCNINKTELKLNVTLPHIVVEIHKGYNMLETPPPIVLSI